MDPSPVHRSSISQERSPVAGAAGLAGAVLPGLSPVEQVLVTVLLKRGLLSTEQVRAAQVYCHEHKRDLRQAILELNLISPELLNQLAFERLSALATTTATRAGSGAVRRPATPLSPEPHPASPRRPQGAAGKGRRRPPCRSWSTRSWNAPATARRPTSISIRRKAACGFATGSTASFRTSCSSSRRWRRR